MWNSKQWCGSVLQFSPLLFAYGPAFHLTKNAAHLWLHFWSSHIYNIQLTIQTANFWSHPLPPDQGLCISRWALILLVCSKYFFLAFLSSAHKYYQVSPPLAFALSRCFPLTSWNACVLSHALFRAHASFSQNSTSGKVLSWIWLFFPCFYTHLADHCSPNTQDNSLAISITFIVIIQLYLFRSPYFSLKGHQ